MKKFMKGCAITAVILLVLGVAMAVVAVSIKGTTGINDVVYSVTGGKVNVDLDLLDGDWGIFGESYYDIDEDAMFDKDYSVVTGDVEQYSLGNAIRNLDIEVGGCTVIFKDSSDDNFYVEAQNMGKFQCYVEDETLYLKSTRKVNHVSDLGDEFKRHKITLYIPQNEQDIFTFENVDIEFGAGLLELDTLSAEELNLEVGAGQITAEFLEARECNIEVGMGEICVEDMMVGNLNAETGMGHLLMGGFVDGDLTAECSMGAIELDLTNAENDFNYQLEAAMGSVEIDGESYAGMAHEKTVDNGAARTMKVECAMGAIMINFE